MDHLASRQNPVATVSSDELNGVLASVAEAFGEAWLNANGEAPLQKLWKRRDALATNQLFLIGDAVKTLGAIDQKWVAKHVTAIKAQASNNRRGAMFELLGLNIFTGAGLQVRPTKRNAAGFDGVITFPDNSELALSLKSHGPSSHELDIEKNAPAIEKLCVEALERQGRTGWKFILHADAYPCIDDWKTLREKLEPLLWQLPDEKGITRIGVWTFVVKRLYTEPHVRLAESPPSYEFQIVASHHRNEAHNLESKLDAARANLERHAKDAPEHRRHGILLRLHENASAKHCTDWVVECLKQRVGSPLAAVFLYQAAVVRNPKTNSSSIGHTIVPIAAPGFESWLASVGGLVGHFLVGTIQREPTPLQFWADGRYTATFDGSYLYQRGHIYHLFDGKGGVIEGAMASVAPGIHQHAILRMPGMPGHLQMQRIAAATDELTLFD